MTFASQLIQDVAAIFAADEFAQAVTYNGAAISAVLESPAPNEVIGLDGTAVRIYVKATDVPAPAYRDTVVVASGDYAGTWRVYRWPRRPVILSQDGGVFTLMLIQDERPGIRAEGPRL